MSKKSHHFLTLWPWPLTYNLEKLIRSGYHYQCVYQIWEQSIPWFLSYRVNTAAGGGRLPRKTITSPDPLDTGDIIIPLKPLTDPRVNKALTITEFIKAFSIYKNVMCEGFPEREKESAYLADIVEMATHFSGLTFYEYHREFSA